MITPTTLEAEWLTNLRQRKRRTLHELTDWMMQQITNGPNEAFYATLNIGPYQILKKITLQRYFAPMLAFVWQKAVLDTHPAKAAASTMAVERKIAGLPWLFRLHMKRFRHDLTFFQTITDLFAEEGFMSVSLHVVQRVFGEIEQCPNNLELAVQLSQWLDEQYQADLEQLGRTEIMMA
ncbi:MAG: hypothetical protein H7839_17045 [Magnetococcus sp. YQC-5]